MARSERELVILAIRPGPGDSTLVMDAGNQRLAVLDAVLNVVRTARLPVLGGWFGAVGEGGLIVLSATFGGSKLSSGRVGDGGAPPVDGGRAPRRDTPMVRKVVACLLRDGSDGPELLVFDHPRGTVQIPKGTLEAGESPHAAVLRELEEESGVSDASIDAKVGDLERVVPRGPDGAGALEEQLWHVFRLRTGSQHPDSWRHEAIGSPEEDGLTFSYRWLVLSRAGDLVDPLYRPVVEALVQRP